MQGWEFAVVAGVLLLLFGGSRLPKLARSLGEARTELEKVRKEATADEPATEPAAKSVGPAAAGATAVPALDVVSVVVADEAAAPSVAAAQDAPAAANGALPPPLPPPAS